MTRPTLRPLLPSLLLTTLLLAAFLALRFLYSVPAQWPALAPHLFLGWIILLFLLTPAAAIIFSAARKSPGLPVSLSPSQELLLGNALLLLSVSILLVIIALATSLATFSDALHITLLLIPWTAFWSLLTALLRRFSPTLTLTISLTLSTICLAAPITLLPLAHASSQWSPAAHDTTLTAIAYATPILPAFQALNPSLPDAAAWSEWPLIYRLSDSAQEIALRARWPNAALLYALLALLPALLHLCTRRWRSGNE